FTAPHRGFSVCLAAVAGKSCLKGKSRLLHKRWLLIC
ncbi:MAG: hypothetical protein ACJAU1_001390, partial [Psychromonas sp.]